MSTSSFSQTLRTIRWVAVAAILVIAIGFAVQMGFGAKKAADPVASTPANIGGPFSLTNTRGEKVTEADFLGKPMLVYFGYSYCPDVCPYALQIMASALDTLGPGKGRITPVFISVDPKRDTPESLAQYVSSSSFPDGLVGLTGTADEVAAAAKAYAVYYKKVGEGDDYIMDHTSAIFLMDKEGKYVAVFTHTSSVDEIAKCLRRHLDGKRC